MTAHRVGIMGGTFDPVHLGHLAAASEVAVALGLQSVIFSPAAGPWHKPSAHLAPARDRLSMLGLALRDYPEFALTSVDLDRGGNTYTIDTLDDLDVQFERDYPGESVEWFFITGADALASLPSWKSPEELLRRATFVGVTRPGHPLVPLADTPPGRVVLVEIEGIDISSTDIRARVAAGEPIDGLVPDSVAEYIHERGLYAGLTA